jgi:hypothetical protein
MAKPFSRVGRMPINQSADASFYSNPRNRKLSGAKFDDGIAPLADIRSLAVWHNHCH